MPQQKGRKWTSEEDSLLVSMINSYSIAGIVPDYRVISPRIPGRSPKQCRERYENSLHPGMRRGDWSTTETIGLLHLIIQHGQNWAKIRDEFPGRTYNAIKKKGRKLLGETVDRNSIPKGATKSSLCWSAEEFAKLMGLHKNSDLSDAQRCDYKFLSTKLRIGRSEADIERKLLQSCHCTNCSRLSLSFLSHQTHSQTELDFKERWTLWKASNLKVEYEAAKSYIAEEDEEENEETSPVSSRYLKRDFADLELANPIDELFKHPKYGQPDEDNLLIRFLQQDNLVPHANSGAQWYFQ